ncbi:MAG TPA: acetoin dehydrogenase dihydrolipoyllysine-residue acetyltransferase subunit [Amaricoccus sp.]|nr:acetoin dehydrogenase dihydrolipoyllysine-residue acetyltransferase subunit [Amaricoccus sp.]
MTVRTLTLPRLGETMEEATVVGWLIEPGAAFRRGQSIVELETDKTVVEYPALGDGVLDEILAESGARVPVGAPLARATVATESDWTDDAPPEPSPPAEPATSDPLAPPAPEPEPDARPRATPVARRLARQAGLPLGAIPGTGRRGRIERADVERATAGPEGTRFFDAPGGRIACDLLGPESAETTLLLHGFAGDRRAWAATAAILARAGRRVAAPDLPSHGETELEAADPAALEPPLAALAAALPGRLHLVGHSLGAVAAVGLAARLGDRVASLTLVTPAGAGREIGAAFVTGMAAARTPGEVAHLLRLLGPKGGAISDDALAAMARETARGRLAALAAAFVGPHGQRVDILRSLATLAPRLPVRAIFGTEDRIVPITHAHAMPPPVAVHFLPTGHMPQWDAPADLAALLLGEPGMKALSSTTSHPTRPEAPWPAT